MPDSNAKTAAVYLAELNGNAQDVSDWVLDLAARADAAEAELARCRPVVAAAEEEVARMKPVVKAAQAVRDNFWSPVGPPVNLAKWQAGRNVLHAAVDAYSAASPEATKAGVTVDAAHFADGESRAMSGDGAGGLKLTKAEQRPRSPLSDEALGEVARKAERLAVERSGEPHVDACNSMAKAVREAIEASQSSDEGAVVLAESADDPIKRWLRLSEKGVLKGDAASERALRDADAALYRYLGGPTATDYSGARATIIERGKLTGLADGWEATEASGSPDEREALDGCAAELRALLT